MYARSYRQEVFLLRFKSNLMLSFAVLTPRSLCLVCVCVCVCTQVHAWVCVLCMYSYMKSAQHSLLHSRWWVASAITLLIFLTHISHNFTGSDKANRSFKILEKCSNLIPKWTVKKRRLPPLYFLIYFPIIMKLAEMYISNRKGVVI